VYTHKKGDGWRIIGEEGEDASKMVGENWWDSGSYSAQSVNGGG